MSDKPTWTTLHVVTLLIVALLSLCAGVWLTDPYWASLVVSTAITLVLTMSMNLINGTSGQFTLSHAAFFGLGAYVSAICAQHLGISPWLCLPLAIVAAGIAAAAIGVPILRLQGYYLATGTLAFALIVEIVVRQSPFLGGPLGFQDLPKLQVFNVALIGAGYVPIAVIATLLVYIVIRNLVHSPLGRAIIATRDDPPAAAAAGISVTRTRLTAFVIGSALAAAAGWMHAFYLRNLSPQLFGADLTFKWMLIMLIGGIGKLPGVIVSTILLSLGPELLGIAAVQQVLALGILMILVVLFAPRGIGGLIDDMHRRSTSWSVA